MKSFSELGVSKSFIKGLDELKIQKPTEIQERIIPILLQQKTDIVGLAHTGTGKTAAFGLPILQNIDPKDKKIQALILAPTRELCQQIQKQLFRFTKYSEKIFSEAVYGGAPIDDQIFRLSRPTHIIVATPGRLLDLLERKALSLEHINTIVLDEADEMLRMGFKQDIDKILKNVKSQRNIWLFSATLPNGIQQLIKRFLKPNAPRVQVKNISEVNQNIQHQYVLSPGVDKLKLLVYFLNAHKEDRGIIFCSTKASAQKLSRDLNQKGLSIDVIEGDMTQKERNKVLRAFRAEKLQFLVATDVAARGLDIPNLAFVAHFELPDQLEFYTHRSGRTGRAGNTGLSVSFVDDKQYKDLVKISKELKFSLKMAK